MDPYVILAGASSLAGLYVLLLFAHRRIPRLPTPDSIRELREDFYALADQFRVFVEQHDQEMGRHHAKVGVLRRKLRKLREEEGEFDDEEDQEELPLQAPSTPVLVPPSRDQQKAALRAALAEKRKAG